MKIKHNCEIVVLVNMLKEEKYSFDLRVDRVRQSVMMWRLLINHIRNGHVSVVYHVNMPAYRFILTLAIKRGSSIKASAVDGVFTLPQQVCVNMSRVKYEPGLPTASFVPNKTNTNHTNS